MASNGCVHCGGSGVCGRSILRQRGDDTHRWYWRECDHCGSGVGSDKSQEALAPTCGVCKGKGKDLFDFDHVVESFSDGAFGVSFDDPFFSDFDF